VFELLKRHLYLEVSAIAKIDFDDYIIGSQNRFYTLRVFKSKKWVGVR
jgi:hypothetical protein